MADQNICKDKDLDFFLVESASGMSREDLLGMGMDAYVLFRSDGSVEMLMMRMSMTGTYSDGVLTFTNPEDPNESMDMKYTVDGDRLTLISEDEDGNTVFGRSDYDAYDAGGSAPTGSGETAEVPVTDGFVNGVMSVVCPEGWYGRINPMMDGMLMLNMNPDSLSEDKNIYVEYGIRECVTIEGERLEDQTNPESGQVWEMAVKEDGQLTAVSYMGGNAVKITTVGLEEDDIGVFGEILSGVKLAWDREESALNICESGSTDFFELRSMTTSSSTGNRSLLTTMGYDWCILFRGDGTVTAKLDRAVTCHWGDGFGAVVNGTWKDGMMTFVNGDETGTIAFTLEGDRIMFVLLDAGKKESPVVFQRSSAEPRDFNQE